MIMSKIQMLMGVVALSASMVMAVAEAKDVKSGWDAVERQGYAENTTKLAKNLNLTITCNLNDTPPTVASIQLYDNRFEKVTKPWKLGDATGDSINSDTNAKWRNGIPAHLTQSSNWLKVEYNGVTYRVFGEGWFLNSNCK
jgi:hypothetical protein